MIGKKTGGRLKGSRNKRTVAIEAKRQGVAKAIAEVIPEAFDGDAHALLIAVYKDPANDLAIRLDAAKAALPYEKPRLAAIAHTGQDGKPLIPEYTDTDVARRIAFVLLKGALAQSKDQSHG